MCLNLCCVDTGYGYVKPLDRNPFPSVAFKTTAESFSSLQDIVETSNPFLVSFDKKIFALGETAVASTRNPITIMEVNNRWENDAYIALTLGGILKQLPLGNFSDEIFLVTGLPLIQSKSISEVEGLKRALKRKFEVLTVENGETVGKTIDIKEVHIISQPRSAYYSLLPVTHKRIRNELALIADLGFKTLDYLVVKDGQETGDSNGEDSIAGMERIYVSLIKELRSLGLPSVKPHEFDSWLSSGYLTKYSDIIEKHFENASKMVVADMKEKLGAFWDRLCLTGSIYFVGGSSKRLQKYLSEELSDFDIYFVDNPQQLIVSGYGAYGRAVMRKLYGGGQNK